MAKSHPAKSERDVRLAELDQQIRALRDQLSPLIAERARLESEQAREDYPNGPFTLHVWRHGAKDEQEYDLPLVALRSADYIENEGSGSTEQITDRHGTMIYDLRGYPYRRVADGYPEIPDDL